MSSNKKSETPLLEMEIVLDSDGAYRLRHFSMLKLKDLEAYHRRVHLPRKWRLSSDFKRLFLE